MDVRAPGLADLADELADVARTLDNMPDVNLAVAQAAARKAQQHAPRRTGTLAGTVEASTVDGRATVLFGGAKATYGAAVHWGSMKRGRVANPFVAQAVTAGAQQWADLYADGVQDALDTLEG